MTICLYTNDMISGTERLMPWRAIVEVAKFMNKIPNLNVSICSGQNGQVDSRLYEGIKIDSIEKGLPPLINYLQKIRATVLFYPISFRGAQKSIKPLGELDVIKIAYIPGGIYPVEGVRSLAMESGLKSAWPYFLESVIPHSWMLSKLKRNGFTSVISFSETTYEDVINNGWNPKKAISAIPGVGDFVNEVPDYSALENLKMKGKKFILFSGAPAEIRGSQILLGAFEKLIRQDESTNLIMLMRKDTSSDFTKFNNALSKFCYKERVRVVYDKMSPGQLKAFFMEAYVVALPFLIVPSEIPLTFFEVLSCGTPVITFRNGGTTKYIESAACIVSRRHASDLCDGLLKIVHNPGYREVLAKHSKEIMRNHPTWEQFSKQWLKAIEVRNV